MVRMIWAVAFLLLGVLAATARLRASSEAPPEIDAHEVAAEAPPVVAKRPRAVPRPTLAPSPISLEATLEALPTVDSLPKGKKAHLTPDAILEAGVSIGEVAERMEKDSTQVASGLDFFRACAEREDIPSSLRVVCLGQYRRFGGTGEFPPEMQAQADALPVPRRTEP